MRRSIYTHRSGVRSVLMHTRMLSRAITTRKVSTVTDSLVVTDLINRIVQILKRDLRQLRISAQDAELMEPVEPWDEW